ncbi:hypothetical protein AAIH25_02100 [Arthrobacter crystallopoietes]|uniref:hypothetical protein n=1 Tax=Crystallibacter crystallopoietes TaxID=37928 RepID=UPI003D1D6DB9
MTTEVWRPLGFDDSNAASYDALHDGVPDWMEESFWGWMKQRFTLTRRGAYSQNLRSFHLDRLREVERVCRVRVGYTGTALNEGMTFTRGKLRKLDMELVVADYLVAEHCSEHSQRELDIILRESGSKWRVGVRAGRPGLVQRVPEGVQAAADHVMSSAGHAGARLAEAWGTAFGTNPNPSLAYSLAVKAVEDAAIPVISPKDATATLGKLIGQVRAVGDWGLPLQREDQQATSSSTVLALMRMLWAGQADRHGGHHDPDLVITQEAAEVAVMTAATLVQWFTSGAVARR